MSSSSSDAETKAKGDAAQGVRDLVDDETPAATLTAEELAALQTPEAGRAVDEDIQVFDISRPRVLRPAQQEGLAAMFEAATKLVAPVMKHELRTEVICEFRGGEPVYWDKYLAQMTEPFNVFPVSYRGLEFQGAISIDASLGSWFVNSLLGGDASDEIGRSLTETESAVATKVVELILDEIHTSLAPGIQVDSSVDGFVASRTQVHVMKPASLAYVCTYLVRWESREATFRYLVPLKLLRPLVQAMEPKSDEQRGRRLDALFGALGQAFMSVELDVAGVLGRPRLPLSKISNLKVGDVLPLSRGMEQPIDITVQGVPKMSGAFGLQHGRYAVVVQNWLHK